MTARDARLDLAKLYNDLPASYQELVTGGPAAKEAMGQLLATVIGKAVQREPLSADDASFLTFFFISCSQPREFIKPILEDITTKLQS